MDAKSPFLETPPRPAVGLPREVLRFVAHQKKWWLLPVLTLLLLLGLLLALSAGPAAPFIYTLF